jgi:lactate dehydrogenase-like 2-hydroxyacid dehydrogenase
MQMLGVAKRAPEMREIVQSADPHGKEPTRCNEDTFSYNWADVPDLRGLWQTTVGILGMGEIGFELARRLRGFSCKVLYNKRNPLPGHTERELNVQYATWDELVSTSDTVCILLPLLKETEQSLNREFFAKMKPGAAFISAGASGVIDETALAETIASGKLFGAAVDNYTWEPIRPDCALLAPASQAKNNVILTPHVAAGNVPNDQKNLRVDDYVNLVHLLGGQELEYRIA